MVLPIWKISEVEKRILLMISSVRISYSAPRIWLPGMAKFSSTGKHSSSVFLRSVSRCIFRTLSYQWKCRHSSAMILVRISLSSGSCTVRRNIW